MTCHFHVKRQIGAVISGPVRFRCRTLDAIQNEMGQKYLEIKRKKKDGVHSTK